MKRLGLYHKGEQTVCQEAKPHAHLFRAPLIHSVKTLHTCGLGWEDGRLLCSTHCIQALCPVLQRGTVSAMFALS